MVTKIALHIRDVDGIGICIMGGCSLFLYLKLRAMNPSTLLGVLQLFCLFLPLEVFGDDDS